MRNWYCALLDARVVFENDLLCFMTFDDEHHRVALLRRRPSSKSAPRGRPG